MNTPSALETLVRDEATRRAAFPVCRATIFLAHAAVAPLPRVVADAMTGYLCRSTERPQEDGAALQRVWQARQTAARLIGADAAEIAFPGPTAHGLSLVAQGLDWHDGDEVLCYPDDYPANFYPWLELERRGVRVRFLDPPFPGDITPELVEAALGPRTRLVALASAHFLTGQRIDVATIGARLHARGVLFSLDAIQTLGAFPLSVAHVDFLSAGAHKWQLGPAGTGLLFVKKKHFEKLRPVLLGAANVEAPHYVTQPVLRFPDTAARYEAGTPNFVGAVGLHTAHGLLLDLGIAAVAERILALKAYLVAALQERGFVIHGPTDPARTTGITSFFHPDADVAALHRRLRQHGVIGSLRQDRAGRVFLRLAPHFYNTIDELDRVLFVLTQGL